MPSLMSRSLFLLFVPPAQQQEGADQEQPGHHALQHAVRQQGQQAAGGDGERDVHDERAGGSGEHVDRPVAGAEHQAGERGLVGEFGQEHQHEHGGDDEEAHRTAITLRDGPRRGPRGRGGFGTAAVMAAWPKVSPSAPILGRPGCRAADRGPQGQYVDIPALDEMGIHGFKLQ